VEEIDDPTDRAIAEALLATREPFIGLSVTARKATLRTERYPVAEDTYATRRPTVVRLIIQYLRSPEPTITSTEADLDGPEQILRGLRSALVALEIDLVVLRELLRSNGWPHDTDDAVHNAALKDGRHLRRLVDRICVRFAMAVAARANLRITLEVRAAEHRSDDPTTAYLFEVDHLVSNVLVHVRLREHEVDILRAAAQGRESGDAQVDVQTFVRRLRATKDGKRVLKLWRAWLESKSDYYGGDCKDLDRMLFDISTVWKMFGFGPADQPILVEDEIKIVCSEFSDFYALKFNHYRLMYPEIELSDLLEYLSDESTRAKQDCPSALPTLQNALEWDMVGSREIFMLVLGMDAKIGMKRRLGK
jgi:hypothetical protein